MAIEYEVRDGALVWIKNPITGVISYVVDVRGKSFAFTLGGREELQPDPPPPDEKALANAIRTCPFCPGNEAQAPPELMRVTPDEIQGWTGAGKVEGAEWAFERRDVEVAYQEGPTAAVKAGLKPGERIVVKGAVRLND